MIKLFNGDLEEVRKLVLNSWHKKYSEKFIHDYTIPFLDWALNSPGKDPELQISYYKKDQLIGFLASLPRNMRLKGKKGKYNITTFFSVDQDHRGFTAYRLAKEFNRRYPLLGYDGAFYYIERQAKLSEEVIKANFKRDKISYDVINETYFLIKILDYKRASKFTKLDYFQKAHLKNLDKFIYIPECRGTTRFYKPSEDLNSCLTMLNNYKNKLRFARIWTEDELAWQLYHRGVSNTLVYEEEKKLKGLLNYYIMPIKKDKHKDRLAKIDNIYFKDLTFKQRKKFLIESINFIRENEDVGGITIFYNPYFYIEKRVKYSDYPVLCIDEFNDQIFKFANFLPDDDSIKTYVIIFNGESFKDIFPFYLDYK